MRSAHPSAIFGIVLLASLLAGSARAQEVARVALEGRVTDAATGDPLPDVNVRLAYTMQGATTDADGRYRIPGVAPGRYEVAASRVGYAPTVVPFDVRPQPEQQALDFALDEAALPLGELEVAAERGRAERRRLRQFERLFLGETQNAEETSILNPEVLALDIDRATRVLTAEASGPLIIENQALGYRIAFWLDRFAYDPQQEALLYSGRPFFEALTPADDEEAARWAEAREQTWRGSLQHLLAAAVRGRAQAEGYVLMRDLTRESTDTRTWEYDDNNAVDIQLLTADQILRPLAGEGQYELSFDEWLRVRFRKGSRDQYQHRRDRSPDEQTSLMTMNVLWATVHDDGYVFPPNALSVEGAMGERRVADLLPREYHQRAAEALGNE